MTKLEKQKKIEEIIDLMKHGKSKKDLISLGFSLNLRKEAEQLYNQRKSDEEELSNYKLINGVITLPNYDFVVPKFSKVIFTENINYPIVIKTKSDLIGTYFSFYSKKDKCFHVRKSINSISKLLYMSKIDRRDFKNKF